MNASTKTIQALAIELAGIAVPNPVDIDAAENHIEAAELAVAEVEQAALQVGNTLGNVSEPHRVSALREMAINATAERILEAQAQKLKAVMAREIPDALRLLESRGLDARDIKSDLEGLRSGSYRSAKHLARCHVGLDGSETIVEEAWKAYAGIIACAVDECVEVTAVRRAGGCGLVRCNVRYGAALGSAIVSTIMSKAWVCCSTVSNQASALQRLVENLDEDDRAYVLDEIVEQARAIVIAMASAPTSAAASR